MIAGFVFCLSSSLFADSSERVAAEIMKSTVRVVTQGREGIMGHGTGFVISADGYVATNSHVVEGGLKYFIVHSDGDRVRIREAVIIGMSPTADLAILKCDPVPGVVVVRISSSELVVGQTVSAVGFPGAIDTTQSWATMDGVEMDKNDGDGWIMNDEAKSDFQPAVFPGSVAKLATLNGVRAVFHSAKIRPGNSGGPLIDAEGRVCGINTAFIPAETAGSDYPISINASELISLAQAYSIPINVSSFTNHDRDSSSGSYVLPFIVVAAFIALILLVALRKPRAMIVAAMHPRKNSVEQVPYRQAERMPFSSRPSSPPVSGSPPSLRGSIRLYGNDLQGLHHEIVFAISDLRANGGRLVIGRKNDLRQLCLPHDSVSRKHAILLLQGGVIFVEDLNSVNGTAVNGVKLTVGAPAVPLHLGDKLTIGEVELLFKVAR